MVGPLWYAPVHGRRAAGRTGRLAGEAAAGEAPDAGPSPAGSTAAARRSPPAGEGVDGKPGSLGGEAAAGEAPDAGRLPPGSTAAARRSPPAGEGVDGKPGAWGRDLVISRVAGQVHHDLAKVHLTCVGEHHDPPLPLPTVAPHRFPEPQHLFCGRSTRREPQHFLQK